MYQRTADAWYKTETLRLLIFFRIAFETERGDEVTPGSFSEKFLMCRPCTDAGGTVLSAYAE